MIVIADTTPLISLMKRERQKNFNRLKNFVDFYRTK